MLHQQSYDALRQGYRAGKFSPVDVIKSALLHARSLNEATNAFSLIDEDVAMTLAQASANRWQKGQPLSPIDGMPMTVKDSAAVDGWPSRKGSRLSSTDPVAASTTYVSRLLDAGAVLFAKTRAPEFNWKGVTDSPAFGITRNPLDLRLTPGGSSGGCAAAVAAGVVRVSLGSDAGGSVRIPAAFTGTIGLKPSFGRIPMAPVPSAFFNVVNTGPIAASTPDLADVMKIVSGADGYDWTSEGLKEATFEVDRKPDAALEIGVLDIARWGDSDPTVKAAMQEAIDVLNANGLDLKEVDFDVKRASDIGAFFYRLGCLSAVQSVPAESRSLLDPGLLQFVEVVETADLADLMAMQKDRDLLCSQLQKLFEKVDVIMLPTLPILPFAAGRNAPEGWHSDDWFSWNPFTPAFNLAQAPALTYPLWPAGSELPVGIQFVSAKGNDDLLVALSGLLETLIPPRIATTAHQHTSQ
ncbi:amidase [Pantoea sp. Tr-811]|uniref:amidase family protein n=1 Tax=Pantoea sp. Tr-811 TaxID=2608361 RepID=UPI00142020C9|nr:amidase family protein [Pantoea sp. Tr-811]NIF30323.1 amidase [Pantoea sp. Tr-811]